MRKNVSRRSYELKNIVFKLNALFKLFLNYHTFGLIHSVKADKKKRIFEINAQPVILVSFVNLIKG